MTQIYGNIKNIDSAKASYGTSHVNGADEGAKTYCSAGNIDELLGYSYKKDELLSKTQRSVTEGFDDYMKSVQEKEKQENIDDAERERERRKNERELAGKLSDEELAALSMMGIDVESAKLSDIMGMVNTMRGEAHREKMQKQLAQILLSEEDLQNAVVAEGTIKAASGVELDNVELADVVAADNSLQEDTQDNIKFTKDDFVYLVKNNLELNKENLYKAHFSGSKAVSEPDNRIYESMSSQLERVVEQAGFYADDESMEGVKLLLANELPVNTDNLRTFMGVKNYFDKNISEAISSMPDNDELSAAKRLYERVHEITPETVYEMSLKGREITIASIRAYMDNEADGGNNGAEAKAFAEDTEKLSADDPKILKAVSDMRNLEEIRLSMTMDAATRMIKHDINIDTRELSKVVSSLKELEQQLIADRLKRNGVALTEENISLVNEMTDKLSYIATAPAGIVATPVTGGGFSVNALQEAAVSLDVEELQGTAGDIKEGAYGRNYETAKRSYEAAETRVRSDLGDSISKAFSNVDDILRELDLPVNYETQRAVRILGYNRLALTESNINDIIYYDRQVNTLIDGFYPEAVMGLIKDGINPLDVPVDELNKIIAERNYNEGVTEAENFATYLRDIERLGEISPEERESYIGIYRIMDKLSKSGDREAGWVFGNGSRLTVRNLISALRSRKATGIDLDVDDSFGMLEGVEHKGSRIDEQIESAFADSNGREIDEDSYQQDILAINDAETMSFMEQHQIEMTMINARAVYTMLNAAGGIYSLVSDMLARIKLHSNAKEEAVDEETGNMADSMTGHEIENSISMEGILESIGGEKLSLTYDDMREQLTELLYGAAASGAVKSSDFMAAKTIMAGFNIMKKMADRDFYQIPCETENGISVINLTIMHDAAKRGNISVHYKSESYGELEADLSLVSERNFAGSMTAGTSEGNNLLMENMSEIEALFAGQGYNAEKVSFGQSAAISGAAYDSQSGKALYDAALAAVRVLARL